MLLEVGVLRPVRAVVRLTAGLSVHGGVGHFVVGPVVVVSSQDSQGVGEAPGPSIVFLESALARRPVLLHLS